MQIKLKKIFSFLLLLISWSFLTYSQELKGSIKEVKELQDGLERLNDKTLKEIRLSQEINKIKKEEKFVKKIVDKFLMDLWNLDCQVREKALAKAFRDFEFNGNHYKELEKKLPQLDPNLRRKVNLLLETLNKADKATQRMMDETINLLKKPYFSIPPLQILGLWVAKRKLINIYRNPHEDFVVRSAALGALLTNISEGGLFLRRGVNYRDLEKALGSPDKNLRYMAAIALLDTFPGKIVSLSKIIPLLLEGLKNNSLYLRMRIQNVLKEFTGEDICIDSSDPLEIRMEGIKKWEEWWMRNKSFKYTPRKKEIPEELDAELRDELKEELKQRHPEDKEAIEEFFKKPEEKE